MEITHSPQKSQVAGPEIRNTKPTSKKKRRWKFLLLILRTILLLTSVLMPQNSTNASVYTRILTGWIVFRRFLAYWFCYGEHYLLDAKSIWTLWALLNIYKLISIDLELPWQQYVLFERGRESEINNCLEYLRLAPSASVWRVSPILASQAYPSSVQWGRRGQWSGTKAWRVWS